MKDKQLQEIKKRSVSGVLFNGFAQSVSLVGGFVLSIYLSAETFGVFTVVAATAAFLGYFSDIGLAAALIQKKDTVSQKDLATTFTIQQLLVIALVAITLTSSSWIGSMREFSTQGVWLFRALVVAFFLSSLKTIPSVLLERELRFRELAIPQILEVISFNAVIIVFAIAGWGMEMFTIAVVVRGIIGLTAIYIIRPWMPSISIYKDSARKLISFGIPFQINSILALFKDQLFVMFLPVILPIGQVGYIGWAKKWAEFPLRLIMDNVIKVTFPTYSRLQSYPEKLTKGINKTTFVLMLTLIPMSVGMLFIVEPLVHLIPRYEKWEPALVSFYLFVGASLIAGISTPLTNALNAIGKINITLKFMVFWTLFTWIVAPLLVFIIGFDAIAATSALMSLAVIAVIIVARRYMTFNFLSQIIPPLVCSGVMAVVLYATKGILTDSFIALGMYMILGAAVYGVSLMLFFQKQVKSEISYIIRIVKQK